MMPHSCVVRNQCSEAKHWLHLHCLWTSVTLQNYITYSLTNTSLHYIKLLLHWTTWHYSSFWAVNTHSCTNISEEAAASISTWERDIQTQEYENRSQGCQWGNGRQWAEKLKQAEKFLRWEEAAPSRTFLEETSIVALKVSLLKVFTKRSSFRCLPWQMIFCKAIFMVPWVTPACYSQLAIPTGHLPHTYPHHNVSLLPWRQS